MDDGLDIPEFLRRKPETRDEQAKRLRRMRREARGEVRPVVTPPAGAYKVQYDKRGHPLPRNMEASSWALLAEIDKADKIKEKEDEAAKNERFRILAAERAERARIKREAKAVQKATKF